MFSLESADVNRMTTSLFIDGPWMGRASSRFWVLLVLAGIIATAGIVADSTATVIGAMIVAPLMTPILGSALSFVLADRRHLVRSVALVLAGALTVIAIGFAFATIDRPPDDYATNAQIAARISPRLVDLLAALATGMVGAFALVRSDISDTLPGVAIAISLVPPLAVVGLLLEVGRYGDAAQAGLLFATNVAAIVATGTGVLLAYRVRMAAGEAGYAVGRLSGGALVAVILMLILVTVPLAVGSASIARDEQLAAQARPIAQAWARDAGWQVTTVDAVHGLITVTALGPPPEVPAERLRSDLNAAGLSGADLTVRLVVGGARFCPAGGTQCLVSAG